MIFKGPAGFGRVIGIVLNTVMCAILSIYVLWVVQNIPGNENLPILTPLGFLVSFIESFAVGYIVGDLIPALSWGQKLAGAIKAKGLAAHFVSVAILALVMVTCISFICMFTTNVQTLGMAGVIGLWSMIYPVLLIAGYIALLISVPIAMKIAKAVSGFDPTAAPPAPKA